MEEMPQNYDEFHHDGFGEITDVIWDGDNTIWDWVGYAVVAYEAMAQTIAEETGKPEPEVAAAMKAFYTLKGTIEDEGLIQGLEARGFFKNVPDYDHDKLIKKVQKVFARVRRKNLHVYKGVQKVFKTIVENNMKNTILTDAPSFQAKMRIKRSHLGPFLKKVNALPSAKIENLPATFEKRKQKGVYDASFDITEIETEKPHTNLEKILQMTREQIRKHVVIIGDNDRKDMELVRRYGCRGIHAVYGEAQQDLIKRLLRFSPERVALKNVAINDAEQPEEGQRGVIVKVTDPRQIMKVLNISSRRKW